MQEYTIEGIRVWLMTTQELSKHICRTSRTIYNWEKNGTLPKPSVTKKVKSGLGTFDQRLYTEDQAKLLLTWMEKHNLFRKGVIIKPEWKLSLQAEWKELEKQFQKHLKGEKYADPKEESKEN